MSTFKEQIVKQIHWYNSYYPSFDADIIHRLILDEIRTVLDYNLKQPSSEARDEYIREIKSYLSFQQTLSTKERITLYALLGADGMFGAG